MKLIDNIVADGCTGIHFWGCAFESIMDGNRIYRNSIDVQDLSSHYRGDGLDFWEFAGCYGNQMLHNVVASEREVRAWPAFAEEPVIRTCLR
jgi:hypothetical protein